MDSRRAIPLFILSIVAGALALTARVPAARAAECAKVRAAFTRQLKALEKLAGQAAVASVDCAFGIGPDDARFGVSSALPRRTAPISFR